MIRIEYVNWRLILALLLLGTALSAPTHAATLSIFDAVDSALQHYPSVKAAEARHDEARAAVGEAQSRWFPSLTLTGTATRYEKPSVVAPIHGFAIGELPEFDRTLYQAGAHVSFTIFDGFSRQSQIRSAKSTSAAAEAAAEGARQAVTLQVVSAYLDILSDGELLAAHDRRLEALNSERDRVQSLLDAGKAADVDRLRVEAVLSAAEAERVRTANALELAERELARITGLPPESTRLTSLQRVNLADTAVGDLAALETRALSANRTLVQSRTQAAAAQAAASAARGARWPQVKLAASYLDFSGANASHETEWNAGLQLTYPIFTGGAVSRRIARADAAYRGSQEMMRRTELDIKQQIDRALARIQDAGAQVTSLQRAVDRFREVSRIEKVRLAVGAGTQTDFLDAEAQLLSASAGLAQAHHQEILARVELARVTGQLNRNWLRNMLEQ